MFYDDGLNLGELSAGGGPTLTKLLIHSRDFEDVPSDHDGINFTKVPKPKKDGFDDYFSMISFNKLILM
jgi:hypothetical protein